MSRTTPARDSATTPTSANAVGSSETAALFDDFLEFGSVGLHVVDNTGKIVWANQTELDLLGYTKEEYIGKQIAEFHADESKIGEILGLLLGGNKVRNYIAPIICKDGHIEYVEINSSMRLKDGKVDTTRCFSACVTDKVLREKEKLEAERIARETEKTREIEQLKTDALALEAKLAKEQTVQKTKFLRRLCHELRNPLAGIRGNVDLMAQQLAAVQSALGTTSKASPAAILAGIRTQMVELQECASAASLAIEHQALIMNDTLTMSKLESGQFEFVRKPLDLAFLIKGALAILEINAQQKGLVLNVNLPDEARFIRTDLGWVKQIIINLLSNAIKFTESGHIDIAISIDNQSEGEMELKISVTDTGMGMTFEETEKLFGEFVQANSDISASYGGSGLGLNIVKEVLANIGGTIKVESVKGKGSTFMFMLPCGVATDEEIKEITQKVAYTSIKPIAPTTENLDVHILIAEDQPINLKILVRYFSKRGYRYHTAVNGQEALDLYRKHNETQPFDIIFMDIQMPIMDGNDATKFIRESEKAAGVTAEVAIIGLSGNVLEDDVSLSKAAGMSDYVGKPYSFPAIESVIERALRGEYAQRSSSLNPASANTQPLQTEISADRLLEPNFHALPPSPASLFFGAKSVLNEEGSADWGDAEERVKNRTPSPSHQ